MCVRCRETLGSEHAGYKGADVPSASLQTQQADAEQPVALFTLDEIARHNKPDDCWCIVRGRVYDVTSWVPRHPGGQQLITLRAGSDCTALVDAYHIRTDNVRAVLNKYYIGDVAGRTSAASSVCEYGDDELAEGSFYAVLKERVHKYFCSKKVDPRTSSALFFKAALILATLALSYIGTFFVFNSTWATILSAAVLGIAFAEVGVSIQHDANHGAFSRSRTLGAFLGVTLDLVGASSYMWRQQHCAGHHLNTNVHGLDPDIRVSQADVRRVTPYQPRHPYQAYQHVYLGLLYGLLALKSVLVDDFQALANGSIGPLKLKPLTQSELAVFWGGKATFALLFVVLPISKSSHSWALLAAAWLTSQFVAGWMLAFLFQVAHVVGDVAYLKPDGIRPEGVKGWAAAQVATSADFSHGSWFWTHISGGLNYQIEHHLFPAIAHTHYPKIATIVMETCKEFGVPYQVYPTFCSAISAHFRHLKEMGNGGEGHLVTIPSLATIG